MARLGDICRFQSGGTPTKGNTAYYGGQIPWITTVALNGDIISEHDAIDWLTLKAIDETAAKIVPANSILVGARVGIGKVAINAVPMSTNQDILSLIDIDEAKWSKKYLVYFISAKKEYLNSIARGATIKGIKKEALEDLELQSISLNKQKSISDCLDKLNYIIAFRKQQLSKLDQLVKSRFIEMFGDITQNEKKWPIFQLSEIADSRLGKMLDSKRQTGENAFYYLANFNVQWFYIDISKLSKMDFDHEDQIEFRLKEGDLLVCEGGEIGRCAVWHNQVEKCFFQKALHRIRCHQNIMLPDYLAWWFKFSSDNNAFENIAGAKATIAHLPGVKLKKLLIATPPLHLQKEFVAFVQKVDKTKVVVKQSLEKLETLKKSLMQEYFG